MTDYKRIIETEKRKISEVEGKILVQFMAEVVEPEYNIAYLIFTDCVYSICGMMGSEVLTINPISYDDFTSLKRNLIKFDPYNVFINKKIVQVRSIGEEYNGHGFELNFEDVFDKSMIIQSIYSGDKPKDLDDCIRLGIGHYFNTHRT